MKKIIFNIRSNIYKVLVKKEVRAVYSWIRAKPSPRTLNQD